VRMYVAAMDPGGRNNPWSLVLVAAYKKVDTDDDVQHEVVLAREWAGTATAPLDQWKTLQEIRALLEPYGVTRVYTDQWSADAIKELALRVGLDVQIRTTVGGVRREGQPANPSTVHKVEMYDGMAQVFAQRLISIPDVRALISDLLSIRRVATRNGVSYELPTSTGGRHCDLASALALALHMVPGAAMARAQQSSAQRMLRMAANLSLVASAHGFNDPVNTAGMSRDRREEVLSNIANGRPAGETLWSRIAAVEAKERAALAAKKEGEAA